MKKILLSLLIIIFSFPVLADDNKKESVFERVMRTGVIRCGYYVYPPATYLDPNTGVLSGLSVDTMNYIAERASLKVEWSEEVTFGNWVPALQAKRFDVVCTPMWPELPMAKAATFSDPMYFSGLYLAVRHDEKRFTKASGGMNRINQPDVTIVSQDGNITSILAKSAFPNAKHYVLSPDSDTSQLVMSIVSKKADVQIADDNAIKQWNDNNEKKVKIIKDFGPMKLQQYTFSVVRGEHDLLNFLNLAVHEINYNGEMDRLLRKWEPEPGKTYLRVAKPYKPYEEK
jgi:ABC-type amino acid transport substrate-binding protein